MIKPTAYLHFSLPADEYAPEDAATVRRSFTYVAPTEVTPGNTACIDMLVRTPTTPFLDASDSIQEENWDAIVNPWLVTKLKKVEDTLDACNDEDARSFTRHFSFDELNLFLEDKVFTFRIDGGNFPAVIDVIEAIRRLIGQRNAACGNAARFLSPSRDEAASLGDTIASTGTVDDGPDRAPLKHERNRDKIRAAFETVEALSATGESQVITLCA